MAPGGGVEVNADAAFFPDTDFRSDRSVHLDHATVYVSDTNPYDILNVAVLVPGRTTPVDVQIGLSGTGSTARSILYSIRGT